MQATLATSSELSKQNSDCSLCIFWQLAPNPCKCWLGGKSEGVLAGKLLPWPLQPFLCSLGIYVHLKCCCFCFKVNRRHCETTCGRPDCEVLSNVLPIELTLSRSWEYTWSWENPQSDVKSSDVNHSSTTIYDLRHAAAADSTTYRTRPGDPANWVSSSVVCGRAAELGPLIKVSERLSSVQTVLLFNYPNCRLPPPRVDEVFNWKALGRCVNIVARSHLTSPRRR